MKACGEGEDQRLIEIRSARTGASPKEASIVHARTSGRGRETSSEALPDQPQRAADHQGASAALHGGEGEGQRLIEVRSALPAGLRSLLTGLAAEALEPGQRHPQSGMRRAEDDGRSMDEELTRGRG